MIKPKGAPFRYKGAVDVSSCKTAKEVIELADLNWNVNKAELLAKIETQPSITNNSLTSSVVYENIPEYYTTYRTDTNEALGIVKGKYNIVQNIAAFKFFDDVVGRDEAIWQTAGCFNNGKKIFVSAKLPKNILVDGDPVENYLVFLTSHDGSSGVRVLMTPIRVMCQNALPAAFRNATHSFSFRHTDSVHGNISELKHMLNIVDKNINVLGNNYLRLAETPASIADVQKLICNHVLNTTELQTLNDYGYNFEDVVNKQYNAIDAANISTRKLNTIVDMFEYYHIGTAQQEIRGTMWGAVNAITGYYCNMGNGEGEQRMNSLLYGDKARKINNLIELVA